MVRQALLWSLQRPTASPLVAPARPALHAHPVVILGVAHSRPSLLPPASVVHCTSGRSLCVLVVPDTAHHNRHVEPPRFCNALPSRLSILSTTGRSFPRRCELVFWRFRARQCGATPVRHLRVASRIPELSAILSRPRTTRQWRPGCRRAHQHLPAIPMDLDTHCELCRPHAKRIRARRLQPPVAKARSREQRPKSATSRVGFSRSLHTPARHYRHGQRRHHAWLLRRGLAERSRSSARVRAPQLSFHSQEHRVG